MADWISCKDAPGECCNSCHEEVEEGYMSMIELYDKVTDKYRGMICCAQFNALPQNWLEVRELKT